MPHRIRQSIEKEARIENEAGCTKTRSDFVLSIQRPVVLWSRFTIRSNLFLNAMLEVGGWAQVVFSHVKASSRSDGVMPSDAPYIECFHDVRRTKKHNVSAREDLGSRLQTFSNVCCCFVLLYLRFRYVAVSTGVLYIGRTASKVQDSYAFYENRQSQTLNIIEYV
eukprot:390148-Amphidinium_carterae.3